MGFVRKTSSAPGALMIFVSKTCGETCIWRPLDTTIELKETMWIRVRQARATNSRTEVTLFRIN